MSGVPIYFPYLDETNADYLNYSLYLSTPPALYVWRLQWYSPEILLGCLFHPERSYQNPRVNWRARAVTACPFQKL